jgi:hypothetical protein
MSGFATLIRLIQLIRLIRSPSYMRVRTRARTCVSRNYLDQVDHPDQGIEKTRDPGSAKSTTSPDQLDHPRRRPATIPPKPLPFPAPLGRLES